MLRQVDQHREIARGQAVAVPRGLQRAAPPEDLEQRKGELTVRRRYADKDDGAGQVTGEERLLVGLRTPDRVDHDIGTEATRQLADRLDGVLVAGVDGVGRSEALGPVELTGVDVDRDDGGRADEGRARDRGVADAATADHGDGVAPPDATGVHSRSETGHDTAAQEAGSAGRCGRVDLGALTRRDERLLDEGTDAEGGRERRTVGQSHLLLRVVGVETVLRLALRTRAALATHRTPVEDDEVARSNLGDTLADRLDDTGGLVAEQEREVVADTTFAVVQVGVADAARLDLHHGLTRARVGDDDVDDLDRRSLAAGDDSLDGVGHDSPCSRCSGCVSRD